MSTAPSSPWYRVPTAWLVFGIPLTAIVSGVAMITISVIHRDGLVVDDYYKQGLGINQTLKRQEQAESMGLTADLEINADAETILVSLRGNETFSAPPLLTLGLYHSTNSGSDQVMEMKQVTPGVYTGKLPSLPNGRWDIVLEQTQWRLAGSLLMPSTSATVELNPG